MHNEVFFKFSCLSSTNADKHPETRLKRPKHHHHHHSRRRLGMDASRRTGWGTEASSGSAPREAQGPIDQDVGNASGTDSSESSFDSSETESGSDNPQRPAPASRNQADADAKARRRTQSARDDDEKSAKRNGYGGDAARGAARADYASEIPPRADAPTTAADPPPQHDSLPPSPSPPPAVKERIKARDVSRRSGDSTVSGASKNAPKSERGVAGGAGPPSRDIHIGSKVVISREGKGKNHLQYSLLFSPTPLPRHLSSSAVLFFLTRRTRRSHKACVMHLVTGRGGTQF